MYPVPQLQVRDPGVSWQTWAHPPFLVAHSLTSNKSAKMQNYSWQILQMNYGEFMVCAKNHSADIAEREYPGLCLSDLIIACYL